MIKARIIGLSSYLPEKVLTNHDLEKMVETSDEWIVSRTGIKERRIASPEESASFMGVFAAKKALENASLKAENIDLILVATMTPDYISPSTAALVQKELGAKDAAAFDMQAACSGFIYGLSMAKAYVESGIYQNVLLVATEKMSSFIDYEDRNTCILFGDGAAAAVIGNRGSGFLIDTVTLGADGSLFDLIIVPGGGSKKPTSKDTLDKKLHYLKMEGREVFKAAVRRMGAAAISALEKAKIKKEEISWFIPHQANVRIIDAIAANLQFPDEKIYKTVDRFGNTSGSSVAIALDCLIQEKGILKGEHLLMVAFGAGLTWGATILTKIEEGTNV
ncbi:MAG TPA: beta-ketoacyl-ACP synthase III [Parachlamydiaceae bacterium]|nr:beta-ketoacyl-ACP synthase III [Parachlamydiaceae bacterium]